MLPINACNVSYFSPITVLNKTPRVYYNKEGGKLVSYSTMLQCSYMYSINHHNNEDPPKQSEVETC